MKLILCGTLLLVCLPLFAGCTTLDLDLVNFGREPEDQTPHVAEMVCLWEPAEGVGLDGLPTRGFAGQILFFSRGRPDPVRVNGDVRIYVFDDHGSIQEQAKPLHEFEFPAEVWNTYLRKTNLGPAYQIFIPYTRKGGNLASCALRVRMTADHRSPLYSKLVYVTLPGRNPADKPSAQTPPMAANSTLQHETEPSIAELAAIQKASAEFELGNQSKQLKRLKSAARHAVQTADYVEQTTTPDEEVMFADDPPVSRRYRMSSAENNE